MIDADLRRRVRERAADRCEYCGLEQADSPLARLQIEHVRPRKHDGTDDFDNLALACIDCNLAKGPNVAGIDPATQTLCELYNPRRHGWDDHFERRGAWISGRTTLGRTTVAVLRMNSDDQVQLRLSLPH